MWFKENESWCCLAKEQIVQGIVFETLISSISLYKYNNLEHKKDDLTYNTKIQKDNSEKKRYVKHKKEL